MEKVVMIGIMSVLLAIPLKKDKPEFSMLIMGQWQDRLNFLVN